MYYLVTLSQVSIVCRYIDETGQYLENHSNNRYMYGKQKNKNEAIDRQTDRNVNPSKISKLI